MKTYRVEKILEHGPGIKSFYFPKPFSVKAGQFINLWIPGVDEKPFSVSYAGSDYLELSVKRYGPFTTALMDIQPGEYLGLRGPFGNHFSIQKNSLLIGGGIGIAPLRILAQELLKEKIPFTSLMGAITEYELIFKDYFAKSSKSFFCTDDGSFGKKGFVTSGLEALLEREKIRYVYAAGPEIMFVALKKILDPLRIPYEFCMERYMKCGIGICGQCTLDDSGVRLCVEGPVLANQCLEDVTELGKPHRDASGKRES
jgi:dihydroorotate dehydrogenase electron transfer subunit